MNNYPTFEDLQKECIKDNISIYEKIGFNDKLRNIDIEKHIFEDIINKIDIKNCNNLKILDLGCGCSNLVYNIIDFCNSNKHEIHLIDGKNNFEDFISTNKETFDVIIVYSVIQHIYENPKANVNIFIDILVSLLNKNGKLFIGDIPNSSKQNRFINSNKGKQLHKLWNILPKRHDSLNENRIDDAFILGIISRYRNYNYNTYLLPQPNILPMNYVREDILIIKE
jgi:hypothetical protein